MRAFFRLFLVRWLIVLTLSPGLCSAQALPSRMQTAVSSLIQAKAIKRGFAANDPRFGSTLQAAGSTVAGSAAAAALVTLAGVTAPAWLTAAVTVGLGALLSVGISLAVDGVKWLLNGDGSVALTTPAPSPAPVSVNGPYWSANNFFSAAASSPQAAIIAAASDAWISGGGQIISCDTSNPGVANCVMWDGHTKWADGTPYTISGSGAQTANYNPSGSPCGSSTGVCRNGVAFTLSGSDSTSTASSLADAVSKMSDADKSSPANPLAIAAIADNAWKQAASQSGYNGLPYDASDPISAADAQAWQQANPSSWPSVGDLVSPQVSSGSSPWSLSASSDSSSSPGTSTGTGSTTGTTPSSQPIDWGTFSPPALEETPTIGSILDPLFNLWPAWASFSFPQHQALCPTPSFTLPATVVNGATLHFTQMCDFLEANNVRYAMQAAFAVAWAILIIFIVMGA